MDAKIELKPCPFCGCHEIVITDEADGLKNHYEVYCKDCGSGTATYNGAAPSHILLQFAVDAWNRRVI